MAENIMVVSSDLLVDVNQVYRFAIRYNNNAGFVWDLSRWPSIEVNRIFFNVSFQFFCLSSYDKFMIKIIDHYLPRKNFPFKIVHISNLLFSDKF